MTHGHWANTWAGFQAELLTLVSTSDASLALSLQLSAALESCTPGTLFRGLLHLQWQGKDACSVMVLLPFLPPASNAGLDGSVISALLWYPTSKPARKPLLALYT